MPLAIGNHLMPVSRRQFLKSAVAVPIGFAGLQRNLTWGEPEVIEAVARWQWYETHKAECPDEQIPTETDLLDFLDYCPAETRAVFTKEAANRLTALYSVPPELVADVMWEWVRAAPPDSDFDYYGDGGPNLAPNNMPTTGGCLSVLSVGTIGFTIRPLEEVQADWTKVPVANRPQHPLAPLVKAWQARPRLLA